MSRLLECRMIKTEKGFDMVEIQIDGVTIKLEKWKAAGLRDDLNELNLGSRFPRIAGRRFG